MRRIGMPRDYREPCDDCYFDCGERCPCAERLVIKISAGIAVVLILLAVFVWTAPLVMEWMAGRHPETKDSRSCTHPSLWCGMTNPIWYRSYRIYPNPSNIDARCDWLFAHDDYDGAEDSHDPRSGFGRTVEECKRVIDQIEAILEEERQQEISDNSRGGVGA